MNIRQLTWIILLACLNVKSSLAQRSSPGLLLIDSGYVRIDLPATNFTDHVLGHRQFVRLLRAVFEEEKDLNPYRQYPINFIHGRDLRAENAEVFPHGGADDFSTLIFTPNMDFRVKPFEWDTLFYSDTDYSCNGDMYILSYENHIHGDEHGMVDSLRNVQVYYDNASIVSSLRYTYGIDYAEESDMTEVRGWMNLGEGYSPPQTMVMKCNWWYDDSGRMVRFVKTENDLFDTDKYASMKDTLKAYSSKSIEEWNNLYYAISLGMHDNRIKEWVEVEYFTDSLEWWSYSSNESFIEHVHVALQGDKVLSKRTTTSLGNFEVLIFNYGDDGKLKRIEMRQGNTHDEGDEHYSEFKEDLIMVYNEEGYIDAYSYRRRGE